MSILIKGMEMPQNCFDCLMSSFGLCNLIEEAPIGDPQKRLDNCPLIPVPPHGDLIDRDALIDAGWQLSRDNLFTGRYEVALLSRVPTIIPAEGSET